MRAMPVDVAVLDALMLNLASGEKGCDREVDMASGYHSPISRLEKQIADLDRDSAAAARKEAELIAKINRAQIAANKATNTSSSNSRLREIEQASKTLADTKKKQSEISTKKTRAANGLLEYQRRQARADEMTLRKVESDQRKLMRAQEAHQQRMALESRRGNWVNATDSSTTESSISYDFFICHASEDKDDFVRELAELLRTKGAKVWYDEFTLRVGSRLRREIDRGLVSSRFGIVVVSEHFFKKQWPQRELDGLFSLDNQELGRILPIWHKVTKEEVVQHSPTLADILALNTGVQGAEEIAEELLKVL